MIIGDFLKNRTNLDLFFQGQPLHASVGSYCAGARAAEVARALVAASIASQAQVVVLSFSNLFSAIVGENGQNGTNEESGSHFRPKSQNRPNHLKSSPEPPKLIWRLLQLYQAPALPLGPGWCR